MAEESWGLQGVPGLIGDPSPYRRLMREIRGPYREIKSVSA